MSLSLNRLFYTLASLIAFVAILYFAKGILIPLSFAFLFAFILYPLVKWLVRHNFRKGLAIVLSIFGVIIVILGVLFLFSTQIIDMASQYSNFLGKLRSTLDPSLTFLNEKVRIIPDIEFQTLLDRLSSFFTDSSFVIISDTVSITSSFFSYLILSLIYTFLLLFYSDNLTRAVVAFGPKKHQKKFRQMLKDVQQVGQQYFTGMIILILVLGVLDSIGLLLLGIDYAFFFGFLAALLAIIPYVGTTLGGFIPTLYAFVTYDSYWYPIGVIAIFWFIQFLEGNFLNPRIVGGNLRINALFSILSLIAGGFLWGLSGMVLFLPMIAIVKVICSYYEELKPLADLIGDSKSQSGKKPNLIKRMTRLFNNQAA